MASTPSDSFHSLPAADTEYDHFAPSETRSKDRRHFSLPEQLERKITNSHKHHGLRGGSSLTRPAKFSSSPEGDEEIEMTYVTDLSFQHEDKNATTVAEVLDELRGGQTESGMVAKIFAGNNKKDPVETRNDGKRFSPHGWPQRKQPKGTASSDNRSIVAESEKDSEIRTVLDAAVPYMTKETEHPVTPKVKPEVQLTPAPPRHNTARPTTPTLSAFGGGNASKEKAVFVYKPTGLKEREAETREVHDCPIPIEWLTPKKDRRHTESEILNQSSSADADDESEKVTKRKERRIRFADSPTKPHRNATAPNMYHLHTRSKRAEDDDFGAFSQIQVTTTWSVTTEERSSVTNENLTPQAPFATKGESSTRQRQHDNRQTITTISAGSNLPHQSKQLPAKGESSTKPGTPANLSTATVNTTSFVFPQPSRELPKPPFPSPTATRFEVQDWIHALIKAHNLPPLPKFSIYHLCYTGRELHQIAFGNDKETGILAYEFIDQITRGKTGLSARQAEVVHDAMIEYGGIKGRREGVWTKDGKPWEVYTSMDMERDGGPTLKRHGHRISSRSEPIQLPKVMMEGAGEGAEGGGGSKLKKLVKKVMGLRVKVKVEMSMGSDNELTDDGRPSSETYESESEIEIEEGAREAEDRD